MGERFGSIVRTRRKVWFAAVLTILTAIVCARRLHLSDATWSIQTSGGGARTKRAIRQVIPGEFEHQFATFTAHDTIVIGEYSADIDPINAAVRDRNAKRLAGVLGLTFSANNAAHDFSKVCCFFSVTLDSFLQPVFGSRR